MVVIVRKARKNAPARVEKVKIEPAVKPKPAPQKKKAQAVLKPGYYYKAFPNVKHAVICAFFNEDRVTLDLVRRSLKDTTQCHTRYFLFFAKAIKQLEDGKALLKMKKADRWKFVVDNYESKKSA